MGCVWFREFADASVVLAGVCLICVEGMEVAFYIGWETMNLGERVRS